MFSLFPLKATKCAETFCCDRSSVSAIGENGVLVQVPLPSLKTAAWSMLALGKLWLQPTKNLKPPALTMVFTGTTWGSPQSHVGPHSARQADRPGRKASVRQARPQSPLCAFQSTVLYRVPSQQFRHLAWVDIFTF